MCHRNGQHREVLSWDSYLWALLKVKWESSVICSENPGNGGRKSAKVGKQEKSCGTWSDVFQQLALARDSTKTLQAPRGSLSPLGCGGWVCHPWERKEGSEGQFPLRPLWSSAEPQHPLSLQPQLLLPIPTAKPLDESSPTPFNVAPKPLTEWLLSIMLGVKWLCALAGWDGGDPKLLEQHPA